jgi:hypothetical protein
MIDVIGMRKVIGTGYFTRLMHRSAEANGIVSVGRLTTITEDGGCYVSFTFKNQQCEAIDFCSLEKAVSICKEFSEKYNLTEQTDGDGFIIWKESQKS